MTNSNKNKRLKTGLDILLGSENRQMSNNEGFKKDDDYLLNISDIKPNVNQPRKSFDEKSIKELAISIKQQGLLMP